MDIIHFEIPGSPVPQGRPRATKAGKHIRMYDPKTSREYKDFVSLIAKQHAPKTPLEGALDLEVNIYRDIPKSTTKKNRELMRREIMRPTVKGDIDNYTKALLDSMNGIIYGDDSQVVRLVANKFYSNNPRSEIKIWEVF